MKVKRNLSISKIMLQAGTKRAEELGMDFSEYVAHLIRKDVNGRPQKPPPSEDAQMKKRLNAVEQRLVRLSGELQVLSQSPTATVSRPHRDHPHQAEETEADALMEMALRRTRAANTGRKQATLPPA
jgi:hypothetical protein